MSLFSERFLKSLFSHICLYSYVIKFLGTLHLGFVKQKSVRGSYVGPKCRAMELNDTPLNTREYFKSSKRHKWINMINGMRRAEMIRQELFDINSTFHEYKNVELLIPREVFPPLPVRIFLLAFFPKRLIHFVFTERT